MLDTQKVDGLECDNQSHSFSPCLSMALIRTVGWVFCHHAKLLLVLVLLSSLLLVGIATPPAVEVLFFLNNKLTYFFIQRPGSKRLRGSLRSAAAHPSSPLLPPFPPRGEAHLRTPHLVPPLHRRRRQRSLHRRDVLHPEGGDAGARFGTQKI